MKKECQVETDLAQIIDENRMVLEVFRGKNVLITGSTGLLGSLLTKTFLKANEAYGLGIRILAHARSRERAEEVLGDTDAMEMVYDSGFDFTEEISACDYIFHTASPTKSAYFIEHPAQAACSILGGTRAVLELARRTQDPSGGPVLIYLSSMEEYGVPYTPGEIMSEDKVGVIDHLKPRSCYPEAKRMCECLCACYVAEYGVDARIARLAQTFGAGIPLSDNRMSMQFAKSALAGQDIVLHTEGKSVSNFCYLTDAIAGLLTIAAGGEAAEAYNICNDPESRTIREIAQLVADEAGEKDVKVVIEIPAGVNFGFAPDNTMRLDSGKLRRLGWQPRVSMAEGYRRLLSYLSQG